MPIALAHVCHIPPNRHVRKPAVFNTRASSSAATITWDPLWKIWNRLLFVSRKCRFGLPLWLPQVDANGTLPLKLQSRRRNLHHTGVRVRLFSRPRSLGHMVTALSKHSYTPCPRGLCSACSLPLSRITSAIALASQSFPAAVHLTTMGTYTTASAIVWWLDMNLDGHYR